MRMGVIGLPLVGKTTLFKTLTHAHLGAKAEHAAVHVGVAHVPDARLEQLAALYKPRKVTHGTMEYADFVGLVKDRARDAAFLGQLREVQALAHVVRLFTNPAVPLASGKIDPAGDMETLELELMLADLDQLSRRMDRVEKDLKKKKDHALEMELGLLPRCHAALEAEKPLRELEYTPEERKILASFMLLSLKPMLYVLNLDESEIADMDQVIERHNLAALAAKRGTAVVAVCGKVEAELAEFENVEAAPLMAAYGLKEPGLNRVIRATYGLLGLISFFTCAEAECRAWTAERDITALKAAGRVHSDMEHGFIKAEVVRWDHLVGGGSMAAARERGQVKLEAKEYVVEDGDVLLFRYSG